MQNGTLFKRLRHTVHVTGCTHKCTTDCITELQMQTWNTEWKESEESPQSVHQNGKRFTIHFYELPYTDDEWIHSKFELTFYLQALALYIVPELQNHKRPDFRSNTWVMNETFFLTLVLPVSKSGYHSGLPQSRVLSNFTKFKIGASDQTVLGTNCENLPPKELPLRISPLQPPFFCLHLHHQ